MKLYPLPLRLVRPSLWLADRKETVPNFLDAIDSIYVSGGRQIMQQQKNNSSLSKEECQWRILEAQEALDMTASVIPAYRECTKLKQGRDSANHKKKWLLKQNIMFRVQKTLKICHLKETTVWPKASIMHKWL